MTDYNKYVLAVNKIFEVIGKIKTNWTDKDNLTYIASLEEYKQAVVNGAKQFSNKKEAAPAPAPTTPAQPQIQQIGTAVSAKQ
ncbi:MAG: hypothetical protein IJ193_06480 [Bacilli bacterium]|nr:hypothetical protein [Bacilli bacterium]